MILRPRQKEFVERSVAALNEHGNTLGVAPTGAGKTIMLSAVVGKMLGQGGNSCILAHRDELVQQNVDKFLKVNPDFLMHTSIVDANSKEWGRKATFAMVPTLSRSGQLATMPTFDLLVIDEAHHAVADTYKRIVDKALSNNDKCKVYGVTATPGRGDKKGLIDIFSNVADQITVRELIEAGNLVPPKTYVVDLGVREELQAVKRTAADFDMNTIEKIMNKRPINQSVVDNWKAKAADRRTVVFCSTLDHASDVTTAFQEAGIAAALVAGPDRMSGRERKRVLDDYAKGRLQVIVNVAVLTEGWDHPPTDCVVLLRPSSFKSTMIQMIGRGLRPVDPTLYPGVTKKDCVVLDFGISTILHGSLEQSVDLGGGHHTGEAPTKNCPHCGGTILLSMRECPLCGGVIVIDNGLATEALTDFVLTEIDIFQKSNFKWIDLFKTEDSFIANGFKAWAGVFAEGENWYALGGGPDKTVKVIAVGAKTQCFGAADDWLNEYESDDSAYKTKKWLNEAATAKQLAYLPDHRNDFGLTRYHASTLLTFKFNKKLIQSCIYGQKEQAA